MRPPRGPSHRVPQRTHQGAVRGAGPPVAWSIVQPFDQINDPVKLRRLVQAILILDAELHLPVVLRRIVEEACDLVDAQYGALGVLSADGQTLDQFLTVGLDSDEEHAIGPRPTGRGVLGTLIVDDKPLRLANLSDSPDSFGTPAHHPGMTSFLGVPVRVHGEVYGNLYLTNKRSAREFSADDEELVLALAMAAGIAIENARLHALVRDNTLTEDRDRIARDLHDSVIQRLFAIGLSLQGTARLVERPDAVLRIADAIDKLDETIRQLRKAIFDIELTINKEGLQPKVLDLMHELRPVLGIHPQVAMSGVVDHAVTGQLAEEVLAVLREALTNVGKHAKATQVVITIAADADLRIVVADDGIGVGASAEGARGGRGLKNMRQRAERLGGGMVIGTSREGGTRLTWYVPLPPTDDTFRAVAGTSTEATTGA
jgi:two-component system, NarL family, sensor histidine kinase DevS